MTPYALPHGIIVLHENFACVRVMCRIKAHPLFPNSKVSKQGTQYIQRSRVVMTSILGRVLKFGEHVHHKNKRFQQRDTKANLKLLPSSEHNKHHHIGLKHTPEMKRQIAASLRQAYLEGRHCPPDLSKFTFAGQKHSEESKRKMKGKRKCL